MIRGVKYPSQFSFYIDIKGREHELRILTLSVLLILLLSGCAGEGGIDEIYKANGRTI